MRWAYSTMLPSQHGAWYTTASHHRTTKQIHMNTTTTTKHNNLTTIRLFSHESNGPKQNTHPTTWRQTSARLHYITVQLIFTYDHKIHLFIFHVFSLFLPTETMMPKNRVINNDHRCDTSHRWRRLLISDKLWSDMNVNTLPEEVVSVHWLPETYSTHYVCYVTLIRWHFSRAQSMTVNSHRSRTQPQEPHFIHTVSHSAIVHRHCSEWVSE